MATALSRGAAASGAGESSPGSERALASLVHHCTSAAGRVVLFVAPDAAVRAGVLREFALRVEPLRRVVRVATESRGGREEAEHIFLAVGATGTFDLRRGEWRIVSLPGPDEPAVVLLVDEADGLASTTLRALLDLAVHSGGRAAVVLVVRNPAFLLDAFRTRGACVELVRLGGAEGAPTRTETGPATGAAPDAAQPVESPPLATVGADTQRLQPLPGRRDALAPREAPIRAYTEAPRRPDPAPAQAPPAPVVRGLLLSVMAALLLVLAIGVFQVVVTARTASIWLSGEAPRLTRSAGQPAEGRQQRSLGPALPENEAAEPSADVRTQVPDLRAAFELLVRDGPAEDQAAAARFLRAHGPDALGYDLLAELEARVAGTPSEAVALLNARSRLRRVLCGAWADDPLGEAPVRLGCPGAAPHSP